MDSKKGQRPSYGASTSYGLRILDAQGKPVGRLVGWGQEGDGENTKVTLQVAALPADDDTLALVFGWPEKIETRDYPFAIKDVPLP